MADNRPLVLVVESDRSIRTLLGAVIQRNQFQPVPAADGATALALLGTNDFDIILIEPLVPMNEDVDVLRHIETTMPHLFERTVVVTALSEIHQSACPQIALARSVVRKPFELETIERHLLECYAVRRREVERKPAHQTTTPAEHRPRAVK